MKKIRCIKRMKWIFAILPALLPIFFSLLFFCILIVQGDGDKTNHLRYETGQLVSPEVSAYSALIYQYAEENGIREYARYLLAIMQVETGGQGVDVMQSLANSGLSEELKTPEKSIEYGCQYFATLLVKARKTGCDIETVIQAYNYGGGYIDYVAQNEKKHTFNLAENFAAAKAQGVKVIYNNALAVKMNGGWRYQYGNMFYVYLVKQYLAFDPMAENVADAVIAEALKYKGWKYVWGGASPDTSFDCSGLVQWCYSTVGITLPRTAQEQYDAVQHITLEEAEPGDLVFFTKTTDSENYITHVGIYVGNNEMFHAGSPIGYGDLTSKFYRDHFVCAGRITVTSGG